MNYVLFLRGINVGGKHKVVMRQLKADLLSLGCQRVETYINSGNLLLESDLAALNLSAQLAAYFEGHYDFPLPFTLLTCEDFLAEQAPTWWEDDFAKRDVLFGTNGLDWQSVVDEIAVFPLVDEEISFGENVLFWGKRSEKTYNKTAYHKLLVKSPAYKSFTIRNANTYYKMRQLAQEFGDQSDI